MSMRSTGLADGIAQQCTCAVCLEEFKNPKLLRCYHSFCERCVKGLLEESGKNIVKCPQCRTRMEIPDGDVKSLKSNFFLNNILELMDKNRKRKEKGKASRSTKDVFFSECRCEKEPVAKCKSCKVLMCEKCVDAHLQNPSTKDHEFTNAKQALCEEHMFEERKFFCQKCEEMVCEKCLRAYHLGHISFDVQRVFSTQKKIMDWFLVKCKSKIPAFKSEIERCKIMEEMTEKHAQDTKNTVDDFFERLIQGLRHKNQELKENIDGIKAEKLKQIYYERENLTMILESVLSGIEFTEQATKAGNEREFLSMRKQIHSRMEELSLVEVPEPMNDGRWDIYLEPPYDPNYPVHHCPLVNGFIIKKGVINARVTMVGGEEGVMYTTFANQKHKFSLALHDERGEKTSMVIPNVRVFIRIPPNARSDEDSSGYQELPIENNDGGTYSFSYEPRKAGLYYLCISINGRPVQDDLEWSVEAPLGFGDRSNQEGLMQLYPPVGAAPAWNAFSGKNFAWTIRRVYYESYTVVRVGAMMDSTPNKWGWLNGKREEPEDLSVIDDTTFPSAIPAWKEGEEWSFFSNENTGKFIIHNNSTGISEVFQRCPRTAVRPYIYPTTYDIFCMDSSKPDDSPLKLPVQQHSLSSQHSTEVVTNDPPIPEINADENQENSGETSNQERTDEPSNQGITSENSNQETGNTDQEIADEPSSQDDVTRDPKSNDAPSNQEMSDDPSNQETTDEASNQQTSDAPSNEGISDDNQNQEISEEPSDQAPTGESSNEVSTNDDQDTPGKSSEQEPSSNNQEDSGESSNQAATNEPSSKEDSPQELVKQASLK